jgi:hypothetical protein
MRSSILRFGLLSALSLTILTACEYEFKDDPPPSEDAEQEVPVDEEEDIPEDAPATERKRPAEPDVRPTLPAGKPYQGSTTLPQGAKRLDLLNLQATNAATLTTNTSEAVTPLFDGADDTLLRTPNINPLDTTITFTQPTKLKALRVRSTYSDFAIAVQIDGGERIILDPIPEGDWGLVVWATPVTAKKVLVQTLRKVRDNYVHVNEIELYQ